MGSASGVPGRPYRIVVNGTTGSGKTTVAKRLAELLGLRHVELDAYRHGPNWAATPDALFRENLRAALSGDRWVADGNYSLARDVVWSRAATLVWLDYPINVVMWRLFWRSIRRGVTRQELWNGNRENLWEHFLTRESLLLWALKTHWRRRRTLPEAFRMREYSHLKVVRLRSPKLTRRWLQTLERGVLNRAHG